MFGKDRKSEERGGPHSTHYRPGRMIYRASRWALEARIGLAPSRSERDPTDDRHRRRAPRASHGSPGPDGATVVHKGNAKVRANADIATRTGVDPERVLIAQDGTVIDLVDGQVKITGTVPDGLVLRRRHQRWWGHLSADAALSEVTP